MDDGKEQQITTPRVSKGKKVVPLRGGRKFYTGIDIGSISSDVVVLDEAGNMVFSDYQRTRGKPLQKIREQLAKVFEQFNASDMLLCAATGTNGRFLAKLIGIPFVNEVMAQATGVSKLYPQLRRATIIEMGGQDSKLIELYSEGPKTGIHDFALNTGCAAGTGSFLDQQAERLGVDIEGRFGQLALESRNVPRMAGRCSVFAKSDMIHLQQQATPNCDIIAGLCRALASNLKSNLGRGREFVKPIIFTGGVAANIGVVKAIEKVFELSQGEFIAPEEHFFTGAIGAVLAAKNKGLHQENNKLDLEKIDRYLRERGTALKTAPRLERLDKPSLPVPESVVYSDLLDQADEPIKAFLGVDVGSISTNVAAIDEQRRVLSKAYLMTAGQPLEAVREGLEMVRKEVAGKVRILGAATTGSGRYLTKQIQCDKTCPHFLRKSQSRRAIHILRKRPIEITVLVWCDYGHILDPGISQNQAVKKAIHPESAGPAGSRHKKCRLIRLETFRVYHLQHIAGRYGTGKALFACSKLPALQKSRLIRRIQDLSRLTVSPKTRRHCIRAIAHIRYVQRSLTAQSFTDRRPFHARFFRLFSAVIIFQTFKKR
ncbi:BadF/BadG/BcrA/BcrD ATPase family protein, partial [Planctomycetota bacterium]